MSGNDDPDRAARIDESSDEQRPAGVLVVEDDDGLRDLQVDRLERALDRPIYATARGTEAVDIVAREDIAVLVLDRNLSDVNGSEVYDRIHEAGFDGHIVVCTSTEPDDRLNENNTAAYLRKPVTRTDLVEAVERFL